MYFFAPYRVINLFILKLKPDSQDFSRRGEGEMVRMQMEAGTRWNTILVTLLTMIFHFLPRPQFPPPFHLMCRKFLQINSSLSLHGAPLLHNHIGLGLAATYPFYSRTKVNSNWVKQFKGLSVSVHVQFCLKGTQRSLNSHAKVRICTQRGAICHFQGNSWGR